MKTFDDFVGTGERGTNDWPDGSIRDVLITESDYKDIQDDARVRLVESLAEALEALRLLHDFQNGCPLEKYESQWNKAMRLAVKVLEKNNA